MTRILVIDDNIDLLRLIELRLSKEGYSVALAESGLEGIAKAAETEPAAIILDVMMPEMDGWEVCSRIRETSNVPILMLTAKSEDADVIKGLDIGADEYLTKPFRLNTLSARIEALLRRRSWDEKAMMSDLEALKKSIVSALSHELRTPVALILNALELALREAFKDNLDSQRTFILDARKNAETLRWLIEDLLLLVRIDEGLEVLVRPTSLHSQLHRVINRSETDLNRRGVQVRLLCEEGLNVLADQVLLRQALRHLFDHSTENTPDRGDVLIMVRDAGHEVIHIDFHDQGPGYPQEVREQIFDRFYQPPDSLSYSRNRLGIGMHIAREIARAHGGDVTLHSKLGEGSTFRMAIPTGQLGAPAVTGNPNTGS